MEKLRRATFTPLVGQTFTVRPNDGREIPLKLTDIADKDIGGRYESFTLNFDPPANETALPDGIYRLANEQLGETEIFISPTPDGGPTPGGYYYEAVFNVYIGTDGE